MKPGSRSRYQAPILVLSLDRLRLGLPDRLPSAAGMRRSVGKLARAAKTSGVRLAPRIRADTLSALDALVRLIEPQLEGADLGVCLDYGHAHTK